MNVVLASVSVAVTGITAVVFSGTEVVVALVITGAASLTLVTVTIISRVTLLVPSLTTRVIRYVLLASLSVGASKLGADLNVSTPKSERLNLLPSAFPSE